MSITFKVIAESEGSSNHLGEKLRKRKWWVFTTASNENENAIENASGLTYYEPHPDNNSTTQTFLDSADITCIEDLGGHHRKWLFIANYKSNFPELRNAIDMTTGSTSGGGGGGSGPGNEQDPSNRPAVWHSETYPLDHEVQRDIFGNPIETTAHEPITGVKIQRCQTKVTITGFYRGMTAEYLEYCESLCGETYNDSVHWKIPYAQAKLIEIKIDPDNQNGYVGHQVTQVYDLKSTYTNGEKGWIWTEVPNRGYYELDPVTSKQKLIKEDNRPVNVPRWLNNLGQALPLGSAPVYRHYKVLEPWDYSTLPLSGV